MKPLPALAAALLLASCSDSDSADDGGLGSFERPSLVLVVSLDTLRADRMSLYGYGRETTPHLERLAADATVFETVMAQATQTLVSHKSMLTGKTPLRLLREETNADLAQLRELSTPYNVLVNSMTQVKGTLAEELRLAGYTTAAFTDAGWMRRGMGFEYGFQHFDDAGGGFETILPKASRWLDGIEGDSFLFLHTYDAHCPYVSRAPYDTKFCANHGGHVELGELCPKTHLHEMELSPADLAALGDHYDGGVASVDAYLGGFLDGLRQRGLYDDALIVVTSDHGEGLGDHAQYGHGGLYLEQLMVPLVVKFPKSWRIRAGRVSEGVELVDLLPTVLEAASIPPPSDLDGRSLLPVALGTRDGRRYLVAQTTFREAFGTDYRTNVTKRAVFEPGKWFLVHDYLAEDLETYDLGADPGCLTDLSDGHQGPVIELMGILEAADLGRADAAFEAPDEAEMSEEMRRQLEKLGYAGAGAARGEDAGGGVQGEDGR